MAKIRKIKEKELIGGTSNTEVYPITHARAVYDKNNTPLSDTLEFLNTEIVWDNAGTLSNMNDFVVAGVYDIKGERTRDNDNLPILNTGGGHSFNARLTVLDSSIPGDGKNDDKCITQVLSFSNRLGQGEVYIRTGKGSSLDSLTWEKWSTLQRNVNVGEVGSLDDLKDNGIYSGVWLKGHYNAYPITFVCVVINDYFIGVAPRRISQFVYGLSKFDGSVVYQSRVWDDSKDKWGEWEILNKNEISLMISAEIKKVTDGIDDTITENVESIVNHIAEEVDTLVKVDNNIKSSALGYDRQTPLYKADKVTIKNTTLDGKKEHSFDIPAATTERAGVMSAEDKNLIRDINKEKNDRFYIADKNGNVVATVSEDGIVSTKFSSKNFREVADGGKYFCIADENGNVIFKVGEKYGVHDIVGDYIMSQYNTKQVCWIDDDFAILNNSSGEILEQYQIVHDWCLSNEVRLDFAFIPQEYSNERDTSKRMEILKMWEDEGFRFLMHPIHRGWYDYSDNTHDIDKVKVGIVKCQRFFKINNILSDAKILVYPGGSSAYPENVNIIRKYVDCGITATNSETNEGVKNGRYQIKRYALSLSADKTKTIVKKELKEYIDRGDWVILYTHLYSFSTEDLVDETSNTIANVLDIVGYVNTLCALRPTEEIWRDRKIMFNYFNK